MSTRVKVSVVAALAVLVLLVVLQNTEAVDTRVLFFTVTMPRAMLLFVAVVTGFVLGLVTAGFWRKKEKPPA